MELHAVKRERRMTDAHDGAILQTARDAKGRGKRRLDDGE
jgi:hypothetical protein